jgi:hypothetical protein
MDCAVQFLRKKDVDKETSYQLWFLPFLFKKISVDFYEDIVKLLFVFTEKMVLLGRVRYFSYKVTFPFLFKKLFYDFYEDIVELLYIFIEKMVLQGRVLFVQSIRVGYNRHQFYIYSATVIILQTMQGKKAQS